MLDPSTGILRTISDGGKGVFDAGGNWYFVSGQQVKKKTPGGVTTIVAGSGSGGYSGDGGLATLAGMNPYDVAIDAFGNIFIADYANLRVRKVNTSGIISTIAGNGLPGFVGDGGPAHLATLDHPIGVAFNNSGQLLIAENRNGRIRKVDAAGVITTIAGGGSVLGEAGPATLARMEPLSIRVNASGEILLSDYTYRRIRKITLAGAIFTVAGNGGYGYAGDGVPATATSVPPDDIAVDGAGNIYLADGTANRIRKISTSGMIISVSGNGLALTGYSGDGGSPLLLQANAIGGIAADGAGNVYFADKNNNRVRMVTASGILKTYAGNGIAGFYGDGGQATAAAIEKPEIIAVDKQGNLYIAMAGGNRVRKVSSSGVITTFAGGGTAGMGDGGPATAAQFSVHAVAVDTAGNVFIADNTLKRIRSVDAATSIITTFAGNGSSTASGDGGPATAAGLNNPIGLAADNKGNVYIAGSTIRKVNAAGVIKSIAAIGSLIAVDTMGNLYCSNNATISRYDIYNYLSVIAGTGLAGYTGDNGSAMAANISAAAITVSPDGKLYFSQQAVAIRSICCLPVIIDKPPVFVKGASTSPVQVCRSSPGVPVDTLLTVTDGDIGDPLTWSVLSGPIHGSLSGFPATAVSTGAAVAPAGVVYTPVSGYSGGDNFRVRISDGTDTAIIQVNLSVVAPSTISISGASNVCVGDTTSPFWVSTTGGTWSASNTNVTIGTAGTVIGVAQGSVTISYSKSTACGLIHATSAVTVNPLPQAQIVPSGSYVCKDAEVTWFGNPSGGYLSSTSGNVSMLSSGRIRGINVGTALITYSFTNSCGVATDTATIQILAPADPGTLSGGGSGCPGDTKVISATVPGGVWSTSDTAIATVDQSGVALIRAAGTAKISYTVTGVCGAVSAVTNVTGSSSPYTGYIIGMASQCMGKLVSFSNPVAGGVWSVADTSIATIDAMGTLTCIAVGTTQVAYSVTDGCGTGVKTANITVLPVPQLTPITGKSVIVAGKTVELRGRAPSGVWSASDSSVVTIDQWGVVTGRALGSAIITYSETASNGCGAFETLAVTVTAKPMAIFNHYPNPASRVLNIRYTKSTAFIGELSLTDVAGKVVATSTFDMPSSDGVTQFSVFGIPNGVYTLTLRSTDGDYTGRVVILE
jgi:sugar lactone lactonase YvrE